MKYSKILIISLLFFLFFPVTVFAADPNYQIRPGSGKVKLNSNFILDILIDSKGSDISFARASLSFDPTYLEVVKAERNSSLFCSYPEEEQKIDNGLGGLVVAGFCQSGVGMPYTTSGDPDVFARVTFKAKNIGSTDLKWEYTGEDLPNMSVIIKDGSPPQNLLLDSPKDATFEIVKSTDTQPTKPVVVPSTGFGISTGFVVSGVLLIILGVVYVKWTDKMYKKKLRTVVVFDNEK